MSNDKRIKLSLMRLSLWIITVSIPVLYVIGYFYRVGYLSSYGVSIDLFPSSIHEYLTYSFISFYYFVVKSTPVLIDNIDLWVIGASIFAVFSLFVVFFEESIRQKYYFRKTIVATRKKWWFNYIFVSCMSWLAVVAIPYLIVIVFAVLILVPYGAYKIGAEISSNEISEYKGCDVNNEGYKYDCIFVYDGANSLESGTHIVASEKHIALYDKEVVVIPLEGHHIRVVRKKNKVN